jgi:hypothetical protein
VANSVHMKATHYMIPVCTEEYNEMKATIRELKQSNSNLMDKVTELIKIVQELKVMKH